MKAVFFLGAGFSQPFGYPMMETFLPHADASVRLTDDDRTFLGKLILEARRANSFLESSPTNLEDILSFSVMGDRLKLTVGEERTRHVQEIIRKVYSDPMVIKVYKDYWKRFLPLSEFFGLRIADVKKDLSIVTTNYDLNIESAAYKLNLLVNPGFSIERVKIEGIQIAGEMYGESGIPLYKLHGSVNWYHADTTIGVKVEDRVVYLFDPEPGGTKSLPLPCTEGYNPPDTPLIIPPSFLKPDLLEALKTIWSLAAKAISEANVIVFVGYSFPLSDTEMIYFLARALMDNPHLRDVYIIDPNADSIIQKLQGPNSKMGSHFKKLLRPVPKGWTMVKDLAPYKRTPLE